MEWYLVKLPNLKMKNLWLSRRADCKNVIVFLQRERVAQKCLLRKRTFVIIVVWRLTITKILSKLRFVAKVMVLMIRMTTSFGVIPATRKLSIKHRRAARWIDIL